MKPQKFLSVLAALAGVAFVGCTAWTEGVRQDVILKSDPEGADVYINGIEVGQAPLIATMRTKNVYTVAFKKEGYRSFETIISPETNLPFFRTGLFTDTGRYNTLKPNPVDAILLAELVPGSNAVDPYGDFALRVMLNDQRLKEGKITPEEHKKISKQLIEAYTKQ